MWWSAVGYAYTHTLYVYRYMNICWNLCTSMGVHMYSICRPVCRPALPLLFSLWTLRTGRSEDRKPVGARFFAPIRTGPVDQPPFYKWVLGHSHWWNCQVVALTIHLHLAPRLTKKASCKPPSVPSWQMIGRNLLYFTFYCLCDCIIFCFFILYLYAFSKDLLAVFMILTCRLVTRYKGKGKAQP